MCIRPELNAVLWVPERRSHLGPWVLHKAAKTDAFDGRPLPSSSERPHIEERPDNDPRNVNRTRLSTVRSVS